MPEAGPLQTYTVGGSDKIALECAVDACETRLNMINAQAQRARSDAIEVLTGRLREILAEKKVDVPEGAKVQLTESGKEIQVLLPPPTELPPLTPKEPSDETEPDEVAPPAA